MKILHVNKFLYRRGGAEAYMEDAAALLTSAGHDVAFFGMQHPLNTHLEYAKHFPPEVEFEPTPSSLGDRSRAVARMFWSPSARGGMAATLDDFAPDVVHVHNIYHQLSPSVLRPLRERNIPAVMTLHDYKLACPTYLFLDKGVICEACVGGHFAQAVKRRCRNGSLMQSTLMAAELAVHTRLGSYDPVTLFLCPSLFMRSKMIEAGVYPERLRLLHNFIDLPATIPATSGRGPVVYAGRLWPEKGVDILVRAAALLEPGVSVVVAGDGPQRSQLESLASQVAPGRIQFTGMLTKSQVQELVASASVMAVPSRCYENQPLAVLEAYGTGVPVAGTALGGIRELVVEGETGALARPEDPVDLARAITQILMSPLGGRELGARGRRVVEESYSAKTHLPDLLEIYAEAQTRTSRQEASR